jgi:hypothetical protein
MIRRDALSFATLDIIVARAEDGAMPTVFSNSVQSLPKDALMLLVPRDPFDKLLAQRRSPLLEEVRVPALFAIAPALTLGGIRWEGNQQTVH